MELAADEQGIRFMTLAGLNPQGAVRAFVVLLRKEGNSGGGYFDSHPSHAQRIERLNAYLHDSTMAKDAVAQTVQQAHDDGLSAKRADLLLERRAWKTLRVHIQRWVASVPTSATAWYYKGLYELNGAQNSPAARKAFVAALERNPSHLYARMELCTALFRENRKLESVHCSRALDYDQRLEFTRNTFGENLQVGGEIEPFTSVVVVRDENGRKYVTTDTGAAKKRGLSRIDYFAE